MMFNSIDHIMNKEIFFKTIKKYKTPTISRSMYICSMHNIHITLMICYAIEIFQSRLFPVVRQMPEKSQCLVTFMKTILGKFVDILFKAQSSNRIHRPPPLPSILYPPFFIFFPIENDILSIFFKVKFFDTINIFRVMIF